MQKETRRKIYGVILLWAAFVLWTVLVWLVDVQPIGPDRSAVGLATLNGFFHRLIGVNWTLYAITDWLGLVPLGGMLAFAGLGFCQWVQRKSWKYVDFDLLVLGGSYLLTLAVFALFEVLAINYRPVLIEGILEASYPSSTTMLALCVMPTAAHQLHHHIRHPLAKRLVPWFVMAFAAFMVIGRLLSGVHWMSDIIGGALFSGGLILLYGAVCDLKS